ncbi:MAG: hypothetical protein CMH60_06460 [Myxococcales bacterium]|nr:hypothetical protein [Myxococcales bacterium]
MSEEILKDIVAAQADLKGRLEQAQIDTQEKLAQLADLQGALEEGAMSAKVVQQRVRQLIGERSGGALKLRAGSAKGGGFGPRAKMNPMAPNTGPKPGAAPSRLSATLVTANFSKLQNTIEQYIIKLLMREEQGSARSNAHRLELALLVDTYRTIEQTIAEMPENAGLLSHLDDFFKDTEGLIRDLGVGGSERLKRIVSYNRQLASELSVLGASVGNLKETLSKRAKETQDAEVPREDEVLSEMGGIYQKLRQELDRHGKKAPSTLMEKILT